MLRLNVNQEKQLTFEVQIGGVAYDQVSSYFRIILDDVEYGFPAKVGSESISVDLPPLNKVIAKKIREGDEVDVKLEIVADGYYLTPWQDKIKLSNPLVVEAKIKDDGFVANPALKTRLVSEDGGAKQRVTVSERDDNDEEEAEEKKTNKMTEDEIADKVFDKLSSKLSELLDKQAVKEQDENEEEVEEACPSDGGKKKVKESKTSSKKKDNLVEQMLQDTLQRLNVSPKSKKKVTLEYLKKNLTREDVFKYMEKAGTKNPKIQEIIYEQASLSAKKDTPFEILRQVVKMMKHK